MMNPIRQTNTSHIEYPDKWTETSAMHLVGVANYICHNSLPLGRIYLSTIMVIQFPSDDDVLTMIGQIVLSFYPRSICID